MAVLLTVGGGGVASATGTPPCVREAIRVPVLSADGAVVVPVEINGIAAAAEVAPHASASFLTDTAGYRFEAEGAAPVGELEGTTYGSWTRLRSLVVGGAEADDVPVVMTRRVRLPPVAGRTVMLELGADVLDQYEMWLDLPGRELVLFRDHGARCPDPAGLLGPGAAEVALEDGPAGQIDAVRAELDGRAVRMEVNLGSNDSIVSRGDAARAGVGNGALLADAKVLTGMGGGEVGRRHAFGTLRLGGLVLARPRIDVEEGPAYDVLGLELFQDRAALFDFPGHRLVLGAAEAGAGPGAGPAGGTRGSAFSSVRTRDAAVGVSFGPERP